MLFKWYLKVCLNSHTFSLPLCCKLLNKQVLCQKTVEVFARYWCSHFYSVDVGMGFDDILFGILQREQGSAQQLTKTGVCARLYSILFLACGIRGDLCCSPGYLKYNLILWETLVCVRTRKCKHNIKINCNTEVSNKSEFRKANVQLFYPWRSWDLICWLGMSHWSWMSTVAVWMMTLITIKQCEIQF